MSRARPASTNSRSTSTARSPPQADALTSTIKLAAHEKTKVTIPLEANGVGTAALDLDVSGPGFSAPQKFALGIESGTPDVYARKVGDLPAGQTFEIDDSTLAAASSPARARCRFGVSPFGAIDAPAVLQALDRYPYGCSEQTVSRAMPLLYANRLASAEHLAIDPDLDGRIKRGHRQGDDAAGRQRRVRPVGRRLRRATISGWTRSSPTSSPARASASSPCPQVGFDNALDHLRNAAVNASDAGDGAGEPLAYALYVLARNGRPVIGDLRYLADTKLDLFKTPMSRAQIGAALAMLGDRARAARVFDAALTMLEGRARTPACRGPTMAPNCATRPPCWRCWPKPSSAPTRRSDALARASAVRRRRARRRRLHVDAGEQLARAGGRSARRAAARTTR